MKTAFRYYRIMLLSSMLSLLAVNPLPGLAQAPVPELSGYKHQAVIPDIGTPTGDYSGEFSSSDQCNISVNPADLPDRPYVGTELYWVQDSGNERTWLEDLNLDFLRIEVTPGELEAGNDDNNPFTDFTQFTAQDFESGKGWNFNNPDSTVTNILDNISVVKFPVMMMMHYGGEEYMGAIPASDEYTEYFLATVYYYNVIKGMNIKYWEVLNEPDWGWASEVTPEQYAEVFKKVAERIKNYPDPRVNSIRLGGPVLGSGDPIDGRWPDGYANKTSDGDRNWREFMPTLLADGSRDKQFDIGFLSWHDYGDTWGLPDNIYNLDQNYAVINRVEAFYQVADDYVAAGGERPPLVVSEMNFDAGRTKDEGKEFYKTFYAALWHTSTLNDYFSTGKVMMVSHFYWKGRNDWPKGLIYVDTDSDNKPVRNPVWWAYQQYIEHTQDKILASYNGRMNRWADAIVTTDANGKMFYLIADNKSDKPITIDFSFDVPDSLLGQVSVSKRTMEKGGTGIYGEPFHEPVITDVYQFQPATLKTGHQVRYRETIPPRTIVYYTVVNTAS